MIGDDGRTDEVLYLSYQQSYGTKEIVKKVQHHHSKVPRQKTEKKAAPGFGRYSIPTSQSKATMASRRKEPLKRRDSESTFVLPSPSVMILLVIIVFFLAFKTEDDGEFARHFLF